MGLGSGGNGLSGGGPEGPRESLGGCLDKSFGGGFDGFGAEFVMGLRDVEVGIIPSVQAFQSYKLFLEALERCEDG